ncbi:BMC domain-containing protein [Lachnospiraceae bacterium 54-53]
MEKNQNAIGVLETNYYANTVVVVDQALKAADVEIVSCHKKLGGRMCHTVLAGETSAVHAAMEAARETGRMVGDDNIKVSISINNPHPEVWKLLNMIESHEEAKDPEKEAGAGETADAGLKAGEKPETGTETNRRKRVNKEEK